MKVAFVGKARVGKDTAADLFTSMCGKNSIKIAFAKPLKDIMYFAQKRCNLPIEKDRLFLQIVGTQWGRQKDPDLWCKVLKKDIDKQSQHSNIFVSDVRFKNELSMLKKEGFMIVKIKREHKESTRDHESEKDLDDVLLKEFDIVIHNNGDLPSYYKALERAFKLCTQKKSKSTHVLFA